jgi:Tfp pilus assembly protein PilE
MGQQQLLLIVLGVIVVGIAVVVGINLFNANAVSSNRDGVVSDLNNLGAMAQQYYKKPTSMGGGGNTFTGWTLPAELDTTANGNYTVTVSAQSVTIQGYGTENAPNGNKINHTATVSPTTISVAKTN